MRKNNILEINNNFQLLKLFLLALILSGCAWTTLTSVKNLELTDIKFNKLLIIAMFSDLDLKKKTEDAFMEQFEIYGVKATTSINLIPPIKNYKEEEILKILEQNNIDGVLVVALQDFWLSHAYIPKSTISKGSGFFYGDFFSYNSYTQEVGGYYISEPNVKFDIRLFENKSGNTVWMATSLTQGNAFANYNVIVKSLAEEVVRKLMEENIIIVDSNKIYKRRDYYTGE